MRTGIVMALWLLGCEHGKAPAVDATPGDSAPIGDAELGFCSAPAGTANITFDNRGSRTTFTRLDAGALSLIGPVTGGKLAGAPSTFSLLYTNADPLEIQAALCCASSDSTCCPADGLVLRTTALADGSEIGSHAVMLQSFQGDATFPGTLTITAFEHPFSNAPGRIAGSVSVVTDTRTVDGSFDNAFCVALLSATI